jgi:type IV pilus assembly protein PilC
MAAAQNAAPMFSWEGKDKSGKTTRGEMRAASESVVRSNLRRQGITPTKVAKASSRGGKGKKVTDKDVTLFTRQLATMMKSGVPLLQTFDIVGKGHANPAVGRLLMDIKFEVETGSSLNQAFRKYPLYFDDLFCNLVGAGEQAGILDSLLDRLATYKEKTLALKAKIKSALMYPAVVIAAAFIITAVIMIFVIPQFKAVFASFGADLPMPTKVVIAISEFFVEYWYMIFGSIFLSIYSFLYTLKRSVPLQIFVDKAVLRLPVFGEIIKKSSIARWARTLATMFSAGVPLVEALESVGGAAGNYVFKEATDQIRKDVSTGDSLTAAIDRTQQFYSMVVQMVSIGEESGALDQMLSKVADFYESEVDEAVEALSSMMEPLLMIVLGVLIGGIVVAMYLPIFKLGSVVG